MNLSRCLVTRSRKRRINAAAQLDAHRARFIDRNLLQLARIDLGHIGKTRAEAIVIRTTQGIRARKVQMIADEHQCPLAQLDVDPAGSVSQNQRLNSQQIESPNRKRDFL